jgi:hypothetical protein
VTTIPDVPLKQAVDDALSQIRACCEDVTINTYGDGQGGAWVELVDVPLGEPYTQDKTFLVFLLPFTLPGSDIYPMFIRGDLSRLDGRPLGEGFAVTELAWPGDPTPRPVVQVSRKTRGSFAAQTATQKVAKVMHWVLSQ